MRGSEMNEMPEAAIAIIGMAGRFPGASSVEQLWKNLLEGRSGIKHIEGIQDGSGKLVPVGAMLDDVDRFDASFFDITPRDATMLDPQRRFFLECAWEALENAGIDPFAHTGAIGVYAGMSASHYVPPTIDMRNRPYEGFQALLANDKDCLATFVSYKLNLRGPAVSVQTACSTSLVAVHFGCSSLLAHECDVVLAGGVTIRLPQGTGYKYEEGFIQSPDGHCRSFDARANGTVFGNGVGVVVLKRLEDALADGDTIHAVIRGSAINNDGAAKVGYTAPSVVGQAHVITEALSVADVDAASIQYIETHGTGTPLGDPIEITALKQAFAKVSGKGKIALGALKSNIGHLESAAGVAGLIKAVLAIKHGTIPANPEFEAPNPEFRIEQSPLYLRADTHVWPAHDGPRRAGVSSFGIGGTNAHVILEEAPRQKNKLATSEASYLVPLSAKTPEALLAAAKSYQQWLSETNEPLQDIAYTASLRRNHWAHRLGVIGKNKAEIAAALGAFAAGEKPPGLVNGAAGQTPPKVVFIFPGQGSQWVGMGRQLYREEPVFRDTLLECDRAIRKEAGFSVIEELDKPEETSRFGDIGVIQPVLFAIEVALAALWRSWGVEPVAVVGHSMGEVAAAYVAGALSIEDAAAIICRRSRLLRKVAGKGAMALVELTLPDAEKALVGYEDRLSVAVSNGPRSTVIAGDPAAIDEVLGKLEKNDVFVRRVKVDIASHSPQMDPLRDELSAAIADISAKAANIAMRSTVTGERVRGDDLLAAYWTDNLRKPVLFSKVVADWITDGHTIFVEMSPHPILLPAVEENLRAEHAEGVTLASLRREHNERQTMLSSLGALFTRGVPINWKSFFRHNGHVVELPAYPWQKQRYWVDKTNHTDIAHGRPSSQSPFVLLGASISPSTHLDERIWQQSVGVANLPWLSEHRVQGEVVFPGTGYIECALQAGAEVFDGEVLLLEGISFEQMMAFGGNQERTIEVVLVDDGGRNSFRISSRAENAQWIRHASGHVRALEQQPREKSEAPGMIAARLPKKIAVSSYYEGLRARQVYHGLPFQGLTELWRDDRRAVGRIRLAEQVDNEGYVVHPALLDACFQVAGALWPETTDTYVPVGLDRFCLHQSPPRDAWVVASKSAQDELTYDLQIVSDEGVVYATLEGLRTRRIESNASAPDPLEGCIYEIAWRPAKPLEAPTSTNEAIWFVFLDRQRMGSAFAEQLAKFGKRCIRVVLDSSYKLVEPNLFQVDRSNPDDYRRLLRDVLGAERPCEGIVFLASLDLGPFERTSASSLSEDLEHGSVSATYVAQAVVRHGFRDAPRLFLVTRGAQQVHPNDAVSVSQAPILGLGKTIAIEYPEMHCTRIDLAPESMADELQSLTCELLGANEEDQIALRSTGRFVARIVSGRFDAREEQVRLEPANGRPFQVEIRRPGLLDRLALHETSSRKPGAGEVLIEVEAAGLNFRDVLMALGVVPDDAPGGEKDNPRLGTECAGRIVSVGAGVTEFLPGDEVVALAAPALASHVVAKTGHCVRKPSRLNWEQAATFHVVFLTALYALRDVGRLERGERVLIHAGAGGVGLAAIQYARHVGAEIFATAGSEWKRDYLRSLGVAHVFDSRSLGFVEEIKRITNGEGVDVVLNSLAGKFIPASISLLRPHGRFLEIGKRDVYENNALGLRPFLRNLSFSLIDLYGLWEHKPERARAVIRDIVAHFETGVFRVLPVEVFPVSRITDAFHFLAQAKHIGKVAIGMKDASARIVAERSRSGTIRPDCTYMITGGLGGLGFSLASWLIDQGARHLMLVGRKGPSDEALTVIRSMESKGARVHCAQADVSRKEDVERLFTMLGEEWPPLGGIVHAAMVLEDGTLLEQSAESFQRVFAPKALGAWNLHEQTKSSRLDFFVMYSSVAALLGSPGQSNYTASNMFLDALAMERSRLGLPAMSIQWGGFSEVGAAVAEHRGKRLSHRGLLSFSPAEGHEAFRRLLLHPRPLVSAARLELRHWFEFYPAVKGLPVFAELKQESSSRDKRPTEMNRWLEIEDSAQLLEKLANHVAQQVSLVLQIDAKNIERLAPLQSLGVDSLVSLELRNRIETTIGLRLSATTFLTYPSVTALAKHLLERLRPEPKVTTSPMNEKVEQLSTTKEIEPVADDDAMLALFDEALLHAEKL